MLVVTLVAMAAPGHGRKASPDLDDGPGGATAHAPLTARVMSLPISVELSARL
jgi:hypothetical protein